MSVSIIPDLEICSHTGAVSVVLRVGSSLIRLFCLQVLYLLGAMSLSMALQLDRHGLWNLLGPSLFALGIMAVAWVRAADLTRANFLCGFRERDVLVHRKMKNCQF